MIVLDSTILIDILRGNIELDSVLKPTEKYCTTLLNLQEVCFGLHQRERKAYELLKETLIILDYTIDAVEISSNIYFQLEKKGKTIGKFDCIIAGIALTHNCNKILTKNAKHFSHIPGIKCITY